MKVTCVGLPSTIMVSACGSWKAKLLERSVLKTSCSALACRGSLGCSAPAASSRAACCTAIHRSGPGAPAARRFCIWRDLDATSQAGSLDDPVPDIPLCARLLSRRRALLDVSCSRRRALQGPVAPAQNGPPRTRPGRAEGKTKAGKSWTGKRAAEIK